MNTTSTCVCLIRCYKNDCVIENNTQTYSKEEQDGDMTQYFWRTELDRPSRLILPVSGPRRPPTHDLKTSRRYRVFGFDLAQNNVVLCPLVATSMSTGEKTFHVRHLKVETCGTVCTAILNKNTSIHGIDINGKLRFFFLPYIFKYARSTNTTVLGLIVIFDGRPCDWNTSPLYSCEFSRYRELVV